MHTDRMAATVAAPPQDPISAILAGVSAHELARFAGRNLVIGRSTKVHSVGTRAGLAGLLFPVPGCGQGWNGLGADADLHPTAADVTCDRCLHHSIASRAATRLGRWLKRADPRQLAFDI